MKKNEASEQEFDEPYDDPSVLRELYAFQGLSQNEIADELDCTRSKIRYRLNKFEIERGYNDPDLLEELYIEQGHSAEEIADRFGCAFSTIHRKLREYGIERPKPYRREETLRRLYHGERMSIPEVANEIGCSKMSVARGMEDLGIERRDTSDALHAYAHKQPASYYADVDGYERWGVKDRGQTQTVGVHRLAAVAWYGIEAVKENVVHHGKEGGRLPACEIPWANWEGNLQLLDRASHTSHHLRDIPWEERVAIAERWGSTDDTQQTIADEYGVARESIRGIIREVERAERDGEGIPQDPY